MQQPPPEYSGSAQGVLGLLQLVINPPQLLLAGQHPTGPKPVSVIEKHVSSAAQQLFGYPRLEQFEVPVGQVNPLFSSTASAAAKFGASKAL
jgi:hypothetical protein